MTAVDRLSRAHRLVPGDDWRVILSPPRLVARFARFALARATGRQVTSTPTISTRAIPS